MKTCRKCLLEKQETEFYSVYKFNANRTETICKKCKNSTAPKKKKFNVKNRGKKKCVSCKQLKYRSEFSINRAITDGRDRLCKPCRMAEEKIKRRKGRQELYISPRYGFDSEIAELYIVKECEVCDQNFYPIRPSHKRCSICTDLVRSIQGGLCNKRYVNKAFRYMRCSVVNAIVITKRFLASTKCCYCNRAYTVDRHKSLDHIIPICRGGSNDPSNINVCCFRCNLSKRDLTLDEWIEQCRCVAKNLFLVKEA